MKFRKLGNTGLIVSEVALGTMQFGGKMNMGNLGQKDTTRMVKLALDRGINFIDTADVYSLGESETLVGNALKGVRTEIVLATKVRLPMSDNLKAPRYSEWVPHLGSKVGSLIRVGRSDPERPAFGGQRPLGRQVAKVSDLRSRRHIALTFQSHCSRQSVCEARLAPPKPNSRRTPRQSP